MKRKLLTFSLVLFISPLSLVLFYTTSSMRSVKNYKKIETNNEEKLIPVMTTNSSSTKTNINDVDESFDYLRKYPELLSCQNSYNKWQNGIKVKHYNFSAPADKKLHEKRFIRGVLIYFPLTEVDYYRDEFKWLYRSWTHMLTYEPAKWRTDLVVFVENDVEVLNSSEFAFMNEMNCRFENRRTSTGDKPMCTLVSYLPLKKRDFNDTNDRSFDNEDERYRYLLKDVNVFDTNEKELVIFYKLLKLTLDNYIYLDSILMAFEGYEYFKSAGYDFLVRSDMDVFLTPLFARWLPHHCNDFNVGRGGYSTDFNTKRFGRIAKNLGLKYVGEQNMGSTWYSTPDQFRLVAYLTLFGMAYLAAEEFAPPERAGKLNTLLWPDWHYDVVLLYGQGLALNHLIATRQVHVVKLENHLDYPSGDSYSVHRVINIHVYHGDDLFSKFAFKSGEYDKMSTNDSDKIKFYCLKMALDAKRMSAIQLYNLFVEQSKKKI